MKVYVLNKTVNDVIRDYSLEQLDMSLDDAFAQAEIIGVFSSEESAFNAMKTSHDNDLDKVIVGLGLEEDEDLDEVKECFDNVFKYHIEEKDLL